MQWSCRRFAREVRFIYQGEGFRTFEVSLLEDLFYHPSIQSEMMLRLRRYVLPQAQPALMQDCPVIVAAEGLVIRPLRRDNWQSELGRNMLALADRPEQTFYLLQPEQTVQQIRLCPDLDSELRSPREFLPNDAQDFAAALFARP